MVTVYIWAMKGLDVSEVWVMVSESVGDGKLVTYL